MTNQIESTFKSAIARGTGEARILMMHHPLIDFSKEITSASLNVTAYDPQSEGNRAVYLFELISLSNQSEQIKNSILDKLAKEESDTWVLEQLFELAALFAKEGDQSAKNAIYNRIYENTTQVARWCGESAVIKVDGIKGLKHIAETRGKDLQKHSDDWQDDSLITFFQEQNPTVKAYEELRKASKSNQNIRAYLDAIEANKKQRKENKIVSPIFDYQFMKKHIDLDNRLVLGVRAKDLSASDIKKIADDFLTETDTHRQELYLCIFAVVPFPYDYKYIFKLLSHKCSKAKRLNEFAVNALSFFKNNEIRNFALKQISESETPYFYTNLLTANYKHDDSKMLSRLANESSDDEFIHLLAESFIKIYQANQTKDCKLPLVALYDKLNCAICRHHIVKIMVDNDVLPNRINDEILFDSYLETRSLHI